MSLSCSSVKLGDKSDNLSYLGQEPTQWIDTPNKKIKYASKKDTIFLFGGMTILQDQLVEAALQSLGENYTALPNPDFESFQKGKAFGNRGQCNPTYFTVGNLVKFLQDLRDNKGISTEEIISKYVYVTAGGCGPCRFGMYITEYKKALRDAGFEGIRIRNFEHDKGIFQGENEEEDITSFSPKFLYTLVKAVLIGDIVNLIGYKMRPYEVHKGDTDNALIQTRKLISEAFTDHSSILLALKKCSKILGKVELNRLQPKPKVMIMGEFWAAMTEGDGNYNLSRFLESEGAECIPQPIINRIMLSIWEAEYNLNKNQHLAVDGARSIDFANVKKKLMIKVAKIAVKLHFGIYAKILGLNDYTIPDMEHLADLAKDFYTLECEGGEGHLEIAHLIESVKDNLSHLVISVKPFGCMPSSAVSDGVQSLVVSKYPEANFLSIETSGEGAANFYSRVQMALYKAKLSAKEEYEALPKKDNIPKDLHSYRFSAKGSLAGTAANLIANLSSRL